MPSDEIARSVAQPIPRLRLPDRAAVFDRRAARLDRLAPDHALSGYLQLMADVARTQQVLLSALPPPVLDSAELARAAAHRMPVLPAGDHRRHREWQPILAGLCERLAAQEHRPGTVADLLRRVHQIPAPVLDEQVDALLGGRPEHVDPATAPFLMAALQVLWVALAAALDPAAVAPLDVPGVCPVCGSLPVASIVRGDGHRYLHCALCASEWHLVRAKCSHCDAVDGIAYRFIEHGNDGVRAETCEQCRVYRKILLQEKDQHVEAVADDLASLALDVLVGEAGYHRASVNPLLWPAAEG
nr:formate dehydrogenase accessory protein FdhE [Tahibacter caeni]